MLQYLKDYKDAFEIIITAFTAVVGMFTLICTIVELAQTAKNYVQDRRDKQLSDCVNSFAKEERVERLSGVNGLANNASIMFSELFYICALEKDALIRELLFDALVKECRKQKEKCMQINSFLVKYSLKENIFISRITIPKERDKMWLYLTEGDPDNKTQMNINKRKLEIGLKEDAQIDSCLLISSQLMAHSLKRAANQSLKGNIFIESGFDKVSWKKCSLKSTALVDIQGEDAVGKVIHMEEVFLWENHFINSRFRQFNCKKVDIHQSSFKQSSFIDFSMYGAGYEPGKSMVLHNNQDSVIKEFSFVQNGYEHVKIVLYQIKYGSWDHCQFKQCRFSIVNFINNTWQDMICSYSKFRMVKFWKNKFNGTFDNCEFNDVKYFKNNLQGTRFIKCIFRNVSFAGSDMMNVIFEDCTFENTNVFKGTQNMDPNNITGKNTSAYIMANMG